MKKSLRLLAVMVAVATMTVIGAGLAEASNITFNFGACPSSPVVGTCPGNFGQNSATYTASGLSVVASGFSSSGLGSPNNLFLKMGSGDETGLGLAGTSDDEINHGQYIYLNMSDLVAHGLFSGVVGIGSLQSGEVASICTTTAVGTPGTTCLTATDSGGSLGSANITWSSADPVLSITATKGNILLVNDVTAASTVPEPASLSLFGIGLLGFGFLFRRQLKATV